MMNVAIMLRQLSRSSRLPRPAPTTHAFRWYAQQANTHAPPPPSSSLVNAPGKSEDGAHSTPASHFTSTNSHDGASPGATSQPKEPTPGSDVDPEVNDLVRRMFPAARRSRRKTQLSTADEVQAMMNREGIMNRPRNPIAQRQGALVDSMDEGRSLELDMLDYHRTSTPQLPPLPRPVRCDAYIGRAEPVERGVTMARALDKLNIKLALNRVRSDIKRQRFHERPGLRRKRLNSERWRKRFKVGFVATIKKVQKMAKKGW